MTRETFIKACKLAEERMDGIFLGGGEPTLHPLFWDFLGVALRHCEDEIGVGVITNGSMTEDAIALARMAKQGAIYAGLSRDKYHSAIDERVVKAFSRPAGAQYDHDRQYPHDKRDIRHSLKVMKQGRAKNWEHAEDSCCCEEITVTPDGKIWACGCMTKQLGTVDNPEIWEWTKEHDCNACARQPKPVLQEAGA
jgi:hypothetical protein